MKHIYDLNYSGGRGRRTAVQGQPRHKVSKTLSQKQVSIIPATWKVEVGGNSGKKSETLSEKQSKYKRIGAWLKW
jgi:hypothetical protein